ncbi:hypothetical protein FMUAM8_49890 [Nocardia cyriacigeorgica]|nr:hypothetical protein FMUAM8_49890 [Nocardia cyriacigeorgica]
MRVRGRGGVDQGRQGRVGVTENAGRLGREHIGTRGDPPLRHIQPLGLTQQVDIAHGDRGVLGDAAQDAHQAVGEGGDGFRIEQFGGVVPRQRQRAVADLADGELDVELGGARVEFDHVQVETGQRDRTHIGGRGRLEGQGDLEQRVVGLRARRADDVDQPLERHIGVRERLQVGAAHLLEQRVERHPGLDLGAQHQGVDEHADQIVERLLAAARDRGADGDIGAVGQPRRPGRQRRVHHHEQGDAVGAGQLLQLAAQLRVDREGMRTTGIGGDLRSRPVGGQLDLIGQITQPLGPVGDLASSHRFRIGLLAQHLALPQRVVGVLHLERRPARQLAPGALGVGGHHIAQQRPQREAVGADVVHDQHHHMGLRIDGEQRGPERDRGGHIEEGARQRHDPGWEFLGGDRFGSQPHPHFVGGQNPLVAGALHLGVHRAQRLVPGQHIAEGGVQRVEVECAGEADGDRNVVDGGLVVEAVEEPHPLLGRRQRHQLTALARHQRHLPARTRGRLHPGGQRGHRGRLEQHPHRDLGVQGGAEAGCDLGGDQ